MEYKYKSNWTEDNLFNINRQPTLCRFESLERKNNNQINNPLDLNTSIMQILATTIYTGKKTSNSYLKNYSPLYKTRNNKNNILLKVENLRQCVYI